MDLIIGTNDLHLSTVIPIRLSSIFLLQNWLQSLSLLFNFSMKVTRLLLLMMVGSFRTSTLGRRKQGDVGSDVSLQWILEKPDLHTLNFLLTSCSKVDKNNIWTYRINVFVTKLDRQILCFDLV